MSENKLNPISFRIAYRNVAVISLAILVLISVLSSWKNTFSLGCGLIIGLSPFISWHLLSRLFIDRPQANRFFKMCLAGLGLFKLGLVAVVIYLLFSSEWVTAIPFIIGMILVHPIIIITILGVKSV